MINFKLIFHRSNNDDQKNNAMLTQALLTSFNKVLVIPHSEGGIIYSGSLDRHDILLKETVEARGNSLTVMHIGAAAQFGYDNYKGKIKIEGYTSISWLGVPDPVSLVAGNSVKNNWFFTKDFSLLWSHGNLHYFHEATPFMSDFKKWREK